MVIIRKATKKDKKTINQIVKTFPKFLMKDIPDINRFFVAEDDGKIIGCCALDVYSKRIAEIRTLAVLNKYQKQGIATELISRCLKLANKKHIQEVLAITSREKLFKNFGFGTFHKEKLALFKVLRGD